MKHISIFRIDSLMYVQVIAYLRVTPLIFLIHYTQSPDDVRPDLVHPYQLSQLLRSRNSIFVYVLHHLSDLYRGVLFAKLSVLSYLFTVLILAVPKHVIYDS